MSEVPKVKLEFRSDGTLRKARLKHLDTGDEVIVRPVGDVVVICPRHLSDEERDCVMGLVLGAYSREIDKRDREGRPHRFFRPPATREEA